MASPTIHVGMTHGRHRGRVDRDAALAYALATNDHGPAFVSGAAVPPLFTSALIQPAFAEAHQRAIEPGAIGGVRGNVHSEHDVRFLRPVEPGSELEWEVTTHSALQTPAGVNVTHRIVVSDVDGSPLVEHLWSTLHLGGTIEADLGPELPDHRFPPTARENPAGTATFEVTRDQPFRYAGASGDRNPHSIDDVVAQSQGFPRKILQGLCTFAMCGSAVVDRGAGGEPGRLRRLAGRFAAPLSPGVRLEVHLFEAGLGEDGARSMAFEATADGVPVVTHGRAEIVAR
jgi:acyl dehydratase